MELRNNPGSLCPRRPAVVQVALHVQGVLDVHGAHDAVEVRALLLGLSPRLEHPYAVAQLVAGNDDLPAVGVHVIRLIPLIDHGVRDEDVVTRQTVFSSRRCSVG